MLEEILFGLSEKLKSKNFLDCDAAVNKIESLLQSQTSDKQKKIISLLFPLAIRSPFEEMHKKMVQAVSQYPEVLTELLPGLFENEDPMVRYWSLVLMCELKLLNNEDLINISNSNESDEIVKFIVDFLAQKPDREVVTHLLKKISDRSMLVRNHAVSHLVRLGQDIFPFIKEHFYHASSEEKYDTIKILPRILKGKTFGLFQKMIEADKGGKLLPYIVAGLGEVRSNESLQLLLKHLEHPSPAVQEEAKNALKKWGPEVIENLLNALKNAHAGTAMTIVEILGNILKGDTLSFLENYFATKTDDIKILIIAALSQSDDNETTRILLNFLKDPSIFVRKKAKEVIKNRGVKCLDLLLSLLSSENEIQLLDIIEIIGEIGSKEAIRPLLYVMDHSRTSKIQAQAINALTRLQKFETVGNIVLLNLASRDIAIRHSIIESFSNLAPEIMLKDLILGIRDKNAGIASGSLAILKNRNVQGIVKLKSYLDQATDRQKEAFILNVSKASSEQILSVLKRDSFTLDDFQEKKLGAKVLKSTFSNENITDIKELLIFLKEEKGSDLHMSIDLPPSIRIHGELIRTTFETLTPEKSRFLLLSMLNPIQKEALKNDMELDFSYEIPDLARFRVNVYNQKNGLAAVFRIIPNVMPSFDELKLEKETLVELARAKNGLILVTGATGSGKSTTLAALIDHINRNNYYHIITIEDPIEFVHPHKRSVISQRELGTNTKSFERALKSALREDPDVILVGEMRDLETMKLGIAASETGHLVFSTLHTINAFESVRRLVSTFPADQHEMVRTQLSGVLRGIISQRLLPTRGHDSRVLAYEILVNTPAIRRCVKDNKIEQITSVMQTSAEEGMITLDKCLLRLILSESIEYDVGLAHSSDKKAFQKMCQDAGYKFNS
ncbi:PilT/PilU family type 4a pilus ATPase [Candidatus Riflebacteria bacterium]